MGTLSSQGIDAGRRHIADSGWGHVRRDSGAAYGRVECIRSSGLRRRASYRVAGHRRRAQRLPLVELADACLGQPFNEQDLLRNGEFRNHALLAEGEDMRFDIFLADGRRGSSDPAR